MSGHDFLVFPSVFEGLGIVVIEAQAMGMHCFISSAVPTEADLGNCTPISLEHSASRWADIIHTHVTKNGTEKKLVDLSDYDLNNVIKTYDGFYSGN